MSVEFDRESPGKFDSRTLDRKTLNRWTGRTPTNTPTSTSTSTVHLHRQGVARLACSKLCIYYHIQLYI